MFNCSHFKSLKNLNLSSNKITYLEIEFEKVYFNNFSLSIVSLNLNNNEFKSFGFEQFMLFKNLKQLLLKINS
jgi:hypothetical protein